MGLAQACSVHINKTNNGVGRVSVRGGGKWISTMAELGPSSEGATMQMHDSKYIWALKLGPSLLTVASDNLRESTSAVKKNKNYISHIRIESRVPSKPPFTATPLDEVTILTAMTITRRGELRWSSELVPGHRAWERVVSSLALSLRG